MYRLLILTILVAVQAGVIKEGCEDGVYFNEIYHEREILKTDIDRLYHLATDLVTNNVYFTYSSEEDEKCAYINLNDKTFKEINGINDGFAPAVDADTNEIYIGASDGIYKYDYNSDKVELYAAKDVNIWTLFAKNGLYYTDFPSQFMYTYSEGETTRLYDVEDTKIDTFIVDKNNTAYFTNATGLFEQPIGVKNATLIATREGARGLALNNSHKKLYVCFQDGIYVASKKEGLVKVVEIDDAFGVTFDNENNLVYSDVSQVVRLKPNKEKHC